MSSRWDFLYDIKPVPIAEHLIEEIAKLLAKDLATWPLGIEAWLSPDDEQRFRPLLEPGSRRPDEKVYATAFRLARLELEREYEQIDDFMRNERWREDVPPGLPYDAMVLLSRYLVEQMLAVIDATEGRIKRPQLVDCLGRTEKKLFPPRIVMA